MRPKTSRQYRATGPHSFGVGELSDPLDTVIRTRSAFFATVNNAAEQRNIDTAQLCDALQRRLRPGEAVTLRAIHTTADQLRDSGLAIPRVVAHDINPEIIEAERAAGLGVACRRRFTPPRSQTPARTRTASSATRTRGSGTYSRKHRLRSAARRTASTRNRTH